MYVSSQCCYLPAAAAACSSRPDFEDAQAEPVGHDVYALLVTGALQQEMR